MWILQRVFLFTFALGYVHFANCMDNFTLCKTTACKSAAKLLLNSIDTSVRPCDDIYQYVCGKWIQTHAITEKNRNRQTTRPDTKTIQQTRLHDILNEKSKRTDTVALKFARQLHEKCLNSAQREKDGLTLLIHHVKQVGGWPLLTPTTELPADTTWQEIYKKIDRYFSSASIFNVEVTRLDDAYELLLTGPKVFFPSEEIAEGTLLSVRLRLLVYRVFINSVSHELATQMRLNVQNVKMLSEIDDLIELEKKIVQAHGLRSPRKTSIRTFYHKNFTIGEFQNMYDNARATGHGRINWLEMIQNKFAAVRSAIKWNTKIVVLRWDYFPALAAILKNTPTHTIVNYIVWHFIRSLLPYTTEKMQALVEGKSANSPTARRGQFMDEETRVKACLKIPNLIYAVDYEYAKRYFHADTKKKVLQILRGVNEATHQSVMEATWMDFATKISFKNEVDLSVLSVGYPDWYSDASIEEYYGNVDKFASNLTFLATVLSVLKSDALRDTKKIGQHIDRKQWYFSGYQDCSGFEDANNCGSTGSLRIPAATFHDILYHPEKPESMNYGAVGYQLGYDLISGYGALCELIDQRNDTSKDCSKRYYDTYVAKTAKKRFNQYNYDISFERFVIDTAVISSVWRAWVEHKKRTKGFVDMRLPKLTHHTTDQLLFISILYNQCDNSLLLNKHVKLSSSFASLPAFGTTFACPERTPMNPARKCNVWS